MKTQKTTKQIGKTKFLLRQTLIKQNGKTILILKLNRDLNSIFLYIYICLFIIKKQTFI